MGGLLALLWVCLWFASVPLCAAAASATAKVAVTKLEEKAANYNDYQVASVGGTACCLRVVGAVWQFGLHF